MPLTHMEKKAGISLSLIYGGTIIWWGRGAGKCGTPSLQDTAALTIPGSRRQRNGTNIQDHRGFMPVKRSLITAAWLISSSVIAAAIVPTVKAQSPTSANASIIGTYAGEEPAFKDEEGEVTGPTAYIFNLLPNGRGFVDWKNQQTGKSGRTFGVYTITSTGKGIVAQARFFPSMDSLAVGPPATDFFETFTFSFSNRKVSAKYLEDSHAPTFPLSQVRGTEAKRP